MRIDALTLGSAAPHPMSGDEGSTRNPAMRYLDFKGQIQTALRDHPAGLTWAQLRDRLCLPYDRPCPTWVRSLEADIGLERTPGESRALVWRLAEDALVPMEG